MVANSSLPNELTCYVCHITPIDQYSTEIPHKQQQQWLLKKLVIPSSQKQSSKIPLGFPIWHPNIGKIHIIHKFCASQVDYFYQ